MDIHVLAKEFVDLVSSRDWKTGFNVTEHDESLLLKTVKAAGFEPAVIQRGELTKQYFDEDRSPTGETYPLNQHSTFFFTDQTEVKDELATLWLDALWNHVVKELKEEKPLGDITKDVALKIEQSIPMEPIMLTKDDDYMAEFVSGHPASCEHKRDETPIRDDYDVIIGVHEHCNGLIHRIGATKTHDALSCQKCYLRVLFPRGIKTYGKLREYLSLKINRIAARR